MVLRQQIFLKLNICLLAFFPRYCLLYFIGFSDLLGGHMKYQQSLGNF
jgi:hypothetical protein